MVANETKNYCKTTLTFFIFEPKNDHEATLFRPEVQEQSLSQIEVSTAYQKIGEWPLSVFELFLENCKKGHFAPCR